MRSLRGKVLLRQKPEQHLQTPVPPLQNSDEAIGANKALAEARDARAASYGPAYERYLRFKRVVRESLGSKSMQYKRIHLRGAAVRAAAEGEGEAEGGAGDAGDAGAVTPPEGAAKPE